VSGACSAQAADHVALESFRARQRDVSGTTAADDIDIASATETAIM
jgi:hypothetical protein